MERIVIIPALNPDECLRELVERNWELDNQVMTGWCTWGDTDTGTDDDHHHRRGVHDYLLLCV